jgi:AAA+ ATPase superfamily predicted ATPase
MSIKNIIGRKEEKAILEKAFRSPDPEFVAVYGRRRVGKTFLIREYFGDSICFEIVGKHSVSLGEQLDNFSFALGDAMGLGIKPQKPSSWSEAFYQLEQFLESSAQKGKKGKRVIFLDELPWLNTPRSKFLSSLEHFWNSWGSHQRYLILVICGSAASWMIQKIVLARGGLHNRLSRQIPLFPFKLSETRDFLLSRGVNLTPFQILELYMTMGGVPYYLKEAEPGLSAAQIIDKSCFSSQGILRDEFIKLYASLFENAEQHQKIVETLAIKRQGLTRNEILKTTGLRSGGSASRRIEELEESGFIQSYIPFGKNANDALYRLSDEYSLFYLNWIRVLGKRSPGEGYWLSKRNTPARRTWAGYSFESICLKHIPCLKADLGISGVETTEAPWRYQPSQKSEIPGAQIDILIDRRDDTINLCEMKFSEAEFTIDKKFFLTMVTTFGVTKNDYAKELVANSLTMDTFFL